MSVLEKIRNWASPKSRTADAERDVAAYLLGALKVVSAYAKVLEHEESISMSEAHLPFGKEQIRYSIEFLQKALRSAASRRILVKLLPPDRAQLVLSSQYEQNLAAVLFFLEHFVPDAEAKASAQEWSNMFALGDAIAKKMQPTQMPTMKAGAEKAHADVPKAISEPIPESPPLPPPTLNWAEREADQPRQLPLPGLADVPTFAERAFIQLAQNWHEGFAVVGREHAPPRHVDELALAAVLLAREHGASFTNVAWQQAEVNMALAEKRPVPWIDRLPWRLAATARLMQPGEHWGVEDLDGTLNHHNSAVRIWTMEVAWMVRPWLERDAALPLLLENVAGTLAGVERAWGLAGALFDSVEHFYAAAESWQPGHFAKQYAERMALLKERGLLATQASFWMTESACRCLIADRAMTPNEVSPAGPSGGTKATMSLSRMVPASYPIKRPPRVV